MKCTANIAPNALKSSQMGLAWVMHMETDLLDGVSNVGSREGQVLQSSGQTAKI